MIRSLMKSVSALRSSSSFRTRRGGEAAGADHLDRLGRIEAMLVRLQRDVETIKLHTSVVLQPHRAIALLASGDRIYVDPRDQGCGVNLLSEGRYEEAELRLIRRHLKPGIVFLDIGANYGFYSICAAPYLRPGGRAIGFEPNPHVYDLFQSSIYINGFSDVVEARRLGVYDVNGTLAFQINEASPGGAHVIPPSDEPSSGHIVTTVPTVRLDDHLPPDIVVDLVKIDVEGHERHALEGMRGLIARSAALVILMECIYDLFPSDEDFCDFIDFLSRDLGLWVQRLLPDGRTETADAEALRGCSCSLVLSRAELTPKPDLTILPVQLQHRNGAQQEGETLVWQREPDGGERGAVIAHGPYVLLPRGSYRVVVNGDFSGDFLLSFQENCGDVLCRRLTSSLAAGETVVNIPLDAPRFEVVLQTEGSSRHVRLRSIEFWRT